MRLGKVLLSTIGCFNRSDTRAEKAEDHLSVRAKEEEEEEVVAQAEGEEGKKK